MTIKSALISTTGPLRKSVELSLSDFGYKHTVNERGDAILSTIVTSGRIAWLAEFALHEDSSVVVASINLTTIFEPKIKPPEIPELLARLNSAVVFGCYLMPFGQSTVFYRAARDFRNGVSPHEISKFLGQLNFPLSLWRELCSKWPKKTNITSRLEASLIRLDAHDGGDVSRQ